MDPRESFFLRRRRLARQDGLEREDVAGVFQFVQPDEQRGVAEAEEHAGVASSFRRAISAAERCRLRNSYNGLPSARSAGVPSAFSTGQASMSSTRTASSAPFRRIHSACRRYSSGRQFSSVTMEDGLDAPLSPTLSGLRDGHRGR